MHFKLLFWVNIYEHLLWSCVHIPIKRATLIISNQKSLSIVYIHNIVLKRQNG